MTRKPTDRAVRTLLRQEARRAMGPPDLSPADAEAFMVGVIAYAREVARIRELRHYEDMVPLSVLYGPDSTKGAERRGVATADRPNSYTPAGHPRRRMPLFGLRLAAETICGELRSGDGLRWA